MVSLTVETALGSFDFLDTSDWEEEEDERGGRRSRTKRYEILLMSRQVALWPVRV